MENNCKLCWDPTLLLDKTVRNNLPYIRQFYAINHKTAFTDKAIPLIGNSTSHKCRKAVQISDTGF